MVQGTSRLIKAARAPTTGPRAYEETGLPLHIDNQSIFKERIYRDKMEPNILHDEITSIDHALTQPWTVDKRYVHNPNLRAEWPEFYNTENNAQIVIGKENYFLSGDGFLMRPAPGPWMRPQHPCKLKQCCMRRISVMGPTADRSSLAVSG